MKLLSYCITFKLKIYTVNYCVSQLMDSDVDSSVSTTGEAKTKKKRVQVPWNQLYLPVKNLAIYPSIVDKIIEVENMCQTWRLKDQRSNNKHWKAYVTSVISLILE